MAATSDARGSDDAVRLGEIARVLERAGLASRESGMSAPTMGAMPLASQPAVPAGLVTPQGQATGATPPAGRALEPPAAATPLSSNIPLLPTPVSTRPPRRISRTTIALLIGLAARVTPQAQPGAPRSPAAFGARRRPRPPH